MNEGPRPLTARALTSAIDRLRPILAGAEILELYAGQGRFSERALLEGGASVLLIEKDRRTGAELKRLFQKHDRSQVLIQDVEKYFASPPRTFDIIFADPPFAFWEDQEYEAWLFKNVAQRAKPGTVFLVKYPKRVLPSQAIFGFIKEKLAVFGESALVYFVYGEASEAKSK